MSFRLPEGHETDDARRRGDEKARPGQPPKRRARRGQLQTDESGAKTEQPDARDEGALRESIHGEPEREDDGEVAGYQREAG